jgi:hypothetical protein
MIGVDVRSQDSGVTRFRRKERLAVGGRVGRRDRSGDALHLASDGASPYRWGGSPKRAWQSETDYLFKESEITA